MTDPAIIAASYAAERNYSHNLDDVIDPSGAVLAIGTEKVDTTTLKDGSPENNDADIHGPMPTEGPIQGRRFTAANSNYLDCGNDSSLDIIEHINFTIVIQFDSTMIGVQCDIAGNHKYNVGGWTLRKLTTEKIQIFWYGVDGVDSHLSTVRLNNNSINVVTISYNKTTIKITTNGVTSTANKTTDIGSTPNNMHIGKSGGVASFNCDFNLLYFILNDSDNIIDTIQFNTLARLPFWSVNYTDYPDNVTEYTDNLPYSSSIISSGTFKVDDDKLQCVSAGTMTYSASYEFDGSEFIKVVIDGVEYAGTGTVTHGNTTVSVAQDSNKVTIVMGAGDTIEGEIGIQFREEV